MTVIADRYPDTKWFAYGFAGCVSLSRIYEDAHWTSDVLMGALVGYTVGKLTLRYNLGYADKVNIIPYLNLDEQCILIQYKF
jgi:membrane-associated phospholipid phosphatase